MADARTRFRNTFLYEFGWRTTVDDLDACYALELGFVFDSFSQQPGSVVLTGAEAPPWPT